MTTFYSLRFETTPTWRARSTYLYPTGTGLPGYNPRHWGPFPLPPMTSRVWCWYSNLHPHGINWTRRIKSHVTTDGQSVSVSWNKAHIWSLRPDIYYCQTVAGLLLLGALSDEDEPIIYNCCWPSQVHSFSGLSPMGLPIIFYCLRLETSIFCRLLLLAWLWWRYLAPSQHHWTRSVTWCSPRTYHIENTASNSMSIVALGMLPHNGHCFVVCFSVIP
jgi:hypothetical protein